MSTETLSLPPIRIRGRTFMAMVIAPELPLALWLTALDDQMTRAAGFFADRPVVVNLAAVLEAEEGLPAVLDALQARDLRVIGVEGIETSWLAGTRWERLPNLLQRLDDRRKETPDRLLDIPDDPPEPVHTVAAAPSLLIDRPVRSGQSIIFEEGDVTVIGSVSSGAEVIAGGSIHIYGTLRGRAIAGLRSGSAARIFCRKLAAELVAVDGLYYSAEQWSPDLNNRAVQVRIEQGALSVMALE